MRLVPLFLAVTASAVPALSAEPTATEHFRQRVWPVLDRACVKCHGPEKQKGKLRLDSLEAALNGGENGAAVVPGKPDESLLLKLIQHALPDTDRMPPKEKLHPEEIADIRTWIANGAVWPAPEAKPAVQVAAGEKIGDAWTDPRNPIVRIFGGRRLDLWSLKPVRCESPPAVADREWPRNAIDSFVLARIEAAGKQPSPEAERRALIRRVTFDLTGLPPTTDDVAAFVHDDKPDAYERVVDRLLASPRYGEHWARMWLDVARYSDSNGFDWDEFRPQAWRFRDYVVRSLNTDKPFDRFIREQLAGDEMVSGEPRTPNEQDALIATGFLRLGPQDNSAAQFGEANKVRQQLMADLVETTSSALLGMTMACARCHDHKYDPISQADHYRLQAFFEGVKGKDDLPLDLAPEQEAIRKENAAIDEQIKAKKEAITTLLAPAKEKLAEQKRAKLSDEERAILAILPEQRTAEQKKAAKALEDKVAVNDDEAKGALDEKDAAKRKEIKDEIAALEAKRRPFTTALVMMDSEEAPPETRIFEGGNLVNPKDAVVPGFLSALDPNPAMIAKVPREKSTGRRTALANWIVSPENPLTARVLVNRVWQSYFGEGIVATPNDFGLAGARPTNPELLDWLASAFVRTETDDAAARPALGWSLKKLHRLIVTSATYRQSSTISSGESPGLNHLLTRQNPRRLSAEALRDAMLATAGKLTDSTGGPPVWPELPQDVLVANPALLDDNKEKTKGWYPSPPEKLSVRSLYMIQKRTVRVPMMEAFDLPENSVSCARRTVSTVAPQALTLLNSPFAVEMAKSFAERVSREAGESIDAQVERTFALAVQRAPHERERAACIQFREQHGLTELCRVVLNLNEFVYID